MIVVIRKANMIFNYKFPLLGTIIKWDRQGRFSAVPILFRI